MTSGTKLSAVKKATLSRNAPPTAAGRPGRPVSVPAGRTWRSDIAISTIPSVPAM